METVINSQLPQADDIDFRSLEYLFVPRIEASPVEPPWVDVIVEPERSDSELLRLTARVHFLEQGLNEATANLADANMQIGYLRSMLDEREEQLKQLPDLRLRAAKSIAGEVEHAALLSEVKRLEAENAEYQSHPLIALDNNVKQILSPEVSRQSIVMLELLVTVAFLLVAAMLIHCL